MGNNFCYQSGAQQANFPQLLLKQSLQGIEVSLTAGNVENEEVECIVQATDSNYSDIPKKHKPSFVPEQGKCIFVGGKQGQKHQILAVVLFKGAEQQVYSSDKSEEDKQVTYEAIQTSLKMADCRMIKSIAFNVFPAKDYTTSATIMLMAIKLCITEKKISNINRINVTLNEIGQVNSFKWVFQQVFKGQTYYSPSKSYSSSIVSQIDTCPNENKLVRQKSNYQDDTP